MIVRIEFPDAVIRDKERNLERHATALSHDGGRRRNLRHLLNVLSSEDDEVSISVEREPK